jgi:hypothetical protein
MHHHLYIIRRLPALPHYRVNARDGSGVASKTETLMAGDVVSVL